MNTTIMTIFNITYNASLARNKSVNIDEETPLSRFIGISVAVFAVIGILGNTLVLFVLLATPSKRFPVYRCLISHLSVADLICSILLILYTPIELNKHVWIYPEWFCPVLYPSISITTNLATGTILIIALERFFGVVKPYWRQLNMRKVCIALATVWGWSILTVVPNILNLRLNTGEYVWCGEFWDGYEKWQKPYGISFFFLAFFIPLLLITFLHGHIINRLCHPLVLPEQYTNTQNKDSHRVIRVLTLIVIAFAVCVSPNKILWFVYDVAPSAWNPDLHLYLRTIQILYYSRVAIDPIVYCTFDTRFKKDCIYTAKRLQGKQVLETWIQRQRAGSNVTYRRGRAMSDTGFSMETKLRADSRRRGSSFNSFGNREINTELLTKNSPAKENVNENNHISNMYRSTLSGCAVNVKEQEQLMTYESRYRTRSRTRSTLAPISDEDENGHSSSQISEQSLGLKDTAPFDSCSNSSEAKYEGSSSSEKDWESGCSSSGVYSSSSNEMDCIINTEEKAPITGLLFNPREVLHMTYVDIPLEGKITEPEVIQNAMPFYEANLNDVDRDFKAENLGNILM